MSLDRSRITFNPQNDFSGVLLQQGRVQLDSDWNEWLAELNRRQQAGTLDLIGQAAVPASTPNAFQITLTPDGNIAIGPGRMYVDGLLAENHGLPANPPTGWIPAAKTPQPIPGLAWDPSLAELSGPNPIPYSAQPYLLAPPALPAVGTPFLVYLDVWQREIDFLSYPDLIEKAIGIDTTGRLQTVWQVKTLVPAESGITCSTPTSEFPEWQALLAAPAIQLTTGVVQSAQATPCSLAPNTGYTGLENQLYRVEIHDPGPLGTATFKWSRDNASVQTAILTISPSGTVLTVQSTGKDDLLRFNNNDWVEILDDSLILEGLHGEIHQIANVVDATSTITLATPLSSTTFPVTNSVPNRLTRVRRWDTNPAVANPTVPTPIPTDGSAVTLENGITLTFSQLTGGSNPQTGQFWNFATRTADSTIEALVQAPPRGIHHHYARLAMVTLAGTAATGAPSTGTATDCRIAWPPSCSSGCCDCTVNIAPTDLTPNNTLQNIVDKYQNQAATTTFCFAPGTYLLTAPVLLTPAHMNFVFEPCGASTVTFIAANINAAAFAYGLFVLAGASNIIFNSLQFMAPAAKLPSDTFAGLPLSAYDTYVQEYIGWVYTCICLRLVGTSNITIQRCTFNLTAANTSATGPVTGSSGLIPVTIAILANGTCTGMTVAGNTFTGTFLESNSVYGFLHTPTVAYKPIPLPQRPVGPTRPLPQKPILATTVDTVQAKESARQAAPSDTVAKTAPAEKKPAASAAAQPIETQSETTQQTAKQADLTDFQVLQAKVKSDLASIPRIGGQLQATPAATTVTPKAVASGSSVLPSLLDQAIFRDNTFNIINYPIFIFGHSGTISCVRNTMTFECGGLWFVEPIRFADLATQVPPEIAYAIGFPLPANFNPTLIAVPAAGPSYRVYAGSSNYTDTTGAVWTPCTSTAGLALVGTVENLPINPITGALPSQNGGNDQTLYQTIVTGTPLTYTFSALPTGFYTVTLKLAVIYQLGVGELIMNATVNSLNAFQNLDAISLVGENVAIDVSLTLWVSGGVVTVTLSPAATSTFQFGGLCAVSVVANWADPSTSLTTYQTQLPAFYQTMAMNAQQGQGPQPVRSYFPSTPTLRIQDNEQASFSSGPCLVALGQDLASTNGSASIVCTGNRFQTGFTAYDHISTQAVQQQAITPKLATGAPLPSTAFSYTAVMVSHYYRSVIDNNFILNQTATQYAGYTSLLIDPAPYAPPFAPAGYLPEVMVSGNICEGILSVTPPRTSYLGPLIGNELGSALTSWYFLNSVYPPLTVEQIRQGFAEVDAKPSPAVKPASARPAPAAKPETEEVIAEARPAAEEPAGKTEESTPKPPTDTPNETSDVKTQTH